VSNTLAYDDIVSITPLRSFVVKTQKKDFKKCHYSNHNDTQDNETQPSNIMHNGIQHEDTQHNSISTMTLFIVTLIINVIILSVAASFKKGKIS